MFRRPLELPTRKQLFVDPEVQGVLVARTIIYWVACTLSIALLLLCWRTLTGPVRPLSSHLADMWFFFGPALVASLLVMPLAVADIIRISNRFAGPLLRLRRAMRALAEAEPVAPIGFRKEDFWYGFAEEFNVIAEELQLLRQRERSRNSDDADGEPRLQAAAAGRR